MNLWFNNAVSQAAEDLGNYWQDPDCTVPAASLPDWAADSIVCLEDIRFASAVAIVSPGSLTTVGYVVWVLRGGVLSVTGDFFANTLMVCSGASVVVGSAVNFTAQYIGIMPGGLFSFLGVQISGTESTETVWPPATYIHSDAGPYGPTGVEYTPALSGLSEWRLTASEVWPNSEAVLQSFGPFGPTGEESLGTVVLPTLPAVDDVRAGVDRGDGLEGRIIVPAASVVKKDEHAGWYHAPASSTTRFTVSGEVACAGDTGEPASIYNGEPCYAWASWTLWKLEGSGRYGKWTISGTLGDTSGPYWQSSNRVGSYAPYNGASGVASVGGYVSPPTWEVTGVYEGSGGGSYPIIGGTIILGPAGG